MNDKYVEFFLNSKSDIVQFECVEISHPNFTRVFRVVRNNAQGLTAKLETGEEVFFEYYPLKVDQTSTEDNLDYGIKMQFGDLGELLPTELDSVEAANSYVTRPTIKYRTYRSDDLSQPMFGPIKLEVTQFSFDKIGAMFEAKAPQLNIHKTGELYTIARFPMLRGFL